MPSRPFTFTEFYIYTATLKSAGMTLGSDGGYTTDPQEEVTFQCSFHSEMGGKTEREGQRQMDANFSAVTEDMTVPFANGKIVTIEGKNYEITFFEKVKAFFGEHLCVYLKEYRQ